jgi:hypothetical protein
MEEILNMNEISIWALCAISLTACAPTRQLPPATRYTRPDTTQQQFMKDRYECLQEAEQRVSGAIVGAYGGASSSRVVANCGVWWACLGGRGYTTDPYGNLAAPPDMVVYFQK